MRWRGRRQSTNVQDMRGQNAGFPGGLQFPGGFPGGTVRVGRGQGGGLGCGTLIIIGVVLWFLGINPLALLGQLGGGLGPSFGPEQQQTQRPQRPTTGTEDEKGQFVSTILASTEDVWTELFKSYGKPYKPPALKLFSGRVNSACGMASAATGPFYCPADSTVYIDLAFYDQLRTQFGADGDFAQAYVLAHEVGHHVQNLVGVLPQFNRMRQSMGKLEVNQMSVKVELQADCFAGVWGRYVQEEGWLEQGDLEEALDAAAKIGDDSIQKRTQGYVVPDAFTHGSAEQRHYWFGKGFKAGRIEACDTFNSDV